MSDEELIRRLQGGDQPALGEVHRRHSRAAFAVAYRALGNATLAEDAVQEAFLDLWRGAARFDPARAKLSTWICVLAHRRAVDIARREARRHAESGAEDSAVDGYTLEEVVVLREDRRGVQRALAALPERQRNVIELAYYGGLTQAQVAERLGVPLGTVKSRMFEGLRVLGASLGGSAELQPELQPG